MKKRGWVSERIADGQEPAAIAALRAVTKARALLVVDYAETRVGLRQMLGSLAGDLGAGVRVLLVARDAGDWLHRDVPGLVPLGDPVLASVPGSPRVSMHRAGVLAGGPLTPAP